MEISKISQAGSVESSDIMVTLAPNESNGIAIDLKSDVLIQFGDHIRETIQKVLADEGVSRCKVTVVDKGALDYTIQARTLAAIERAR